MKKNKKNMKMKKKKKNIKKMIRSFSLLIRDLIQKKIKRL